MNRLLIILFIAFNYSQDVTLTFDCLEEVMAGSEGNMLTINLENDIYLDGAQMELDLGTTNIEIVNVISGELLPDVNYTAFDVDSTYLTILTFNMSGVLIDPSSGSLIHIEYNAPTYNTEFNVSIIDVVTIEVPGYEIVENINYSDTCNISVVEPPEDVYLGIGEVDLENNTIEFIMNNTINVHGIQFSLTGIKVGNQITELGGSANENGFWSSTNGSTIIISLIGAGGIIPPSEGSLAFFSIESVDSSAVCITDIYIGGWPDPPEDIVIGDCVTITQDCSIPYDTNNDGILNVLDVVEVVNYILGEADLLCPLIGDDSVNVLEIVIMVNIILGNG